jgi:hypothetical protein
LASCAARSASRFASAPLAASGLRGGDLGTDGGQRRKIERAGIALLLPGQHCARQRGQSDARGLGLLGIEMQRAIFLLGFGGFLLGASSASFAPGARRNAAAAPPRSPAQHRSGDHKNLFHHFVSGARAARG